MTWLPVVGHENYLVSDDGRVKSLPRHRTSGGELKLYTRPNGYLSVALGRGTHHLVHRLVAAAFIGPCPDGEEVRHLNGEKTDNHLDNLAYGTRSENMRDTVNLGRHVFARRTHCPRDHPLVEGNLVPSSLKKGRRDCLTCSRERNRRGGQLTSGSRI